MLEVQPTGVDAVSLVIFFAIGLLGGAHCLGMCGPLVMLYSKGLDKETHTDAMTWYDVRQHAFFNLGRTLSYTVIGIAMGILGSVFFDVAAVASIGDGLRAVTGIVVGLAIIVAGIGYIFRGNTRVFSTGSSRIFNTVYNSITQRINRWVTGFGIVGLGAMHGFLPCPILYPAFLYAFSRGSPIEGGLSLAALGLGTFPTLFVYGLFFQSITPETRSRLHRVLGIVFLFLGYVPLSMGLALIGIEVPRISIPIHQPLG
ncbi:MAG: sulfite exporter TauE/SafE family protein [Halobacteria archaeon]|nr:sulfite exporter TauE/SafE family protein [Halobacteria archaeon]